MQQKHFKTPDCKKTNYWRWILWLVNINLINLVGFLGLTLYSVKYIISLVTFMYKEQKFLAPAHWRRRENRLWQKSMSKKMNLLTALSDVLNVPAHAPAFLLR